MKKKIISTLLVAGMVLSMAACGGSKDAAPAPAEAPEATEAPADEVSAPAEVAADDTAELTYAVEAGSAGEEAAQDNGFTYNAVASQADALMEVNSGMSDAAIIDLLMAGAMIGEGTSYPDMIHTDELTTEEYVVGCRKGSDLASFVNAVLAETYADGTLMDIATTYGVQESIVEQAACEYVAAEADSDVEYIQGKGTLIVGITDFAPMDYKDEAGEWIGFDADMAKIVADKLGVEVQFVEIDWDTKTMELDSQNIDIIWNGMTLTPEVDNAMECSAPYCNNAQVVVIKK